MNPNWTAVHYDLSARRFRPIGSVDGVAYSHVRLDGKPQRLFLGHPLVCDRQDVVLALVQTGPERFLVTVHNPTAVPVRVTLKESPFVLLVAECPGPVDVPVGDQVVAALAPVKR
jgi:hypothetical protein